MSYFARLRGRDSLRRPSAARYDLETLERRTMLSGTAASLAASKAPIASVTALTSSLSTAVTGAKVTFTATVEDASNDAPIAAGKVNFVVESPKKIVLGNVKLSKQGEASISTTELTSITKYRVKAEYTPSNSRISASVAGSVTVKVIPVPLNVPTATTIVSGARTAEVGQDVPLVATVKDAGTGDEVDAGEVEPLTGTVAFLTDSADPVVLGEANLNKNGNASLATDKLRNLGTYQVEAEYLPANNYFKLSTSAPTPVTISPATRRAPTVTSLQAMPDPIETGEAITLNATVDNANSSLADGVVKFVTVARHPVVIGKVDVGTFDQQVSLTTDKLNKVGSYQIRAEYSPDTNRFAGSTSAPITVAVTPLTAVSFLVTPLVSHGHVGEPIGFAVTALNARKQPLTNYTGTVAFSSPTDSWTIFPKSVYVSLKIAPPPPESTGLATFNPGAYTFTPADHGSHTFVGAVTFGKGGAENVQVTQADDPKVVGRATFAIG